MIKKEPTKQQSKPIDSIFDDEDIFSDSLLNKPKVSGSKSKEVTSKSNETQAKQEAKSNIKII